MNDNTDVPCLVVLLIFALTVAGCQNPDIATDHDSSAQAVSKTQQGDVNAEDDPGEEGDQSIDLVLSIEGTDPGVLVTGKVLVEGKVFETSEEYPELVVMLVPGTATNRIYTGLYLKDGTFQIHGVKPGRYWLVLQDPAFAADLDLKWAQRVNNEVSIDAGGGTTINIGTIGLKLFDLKYKNLWHGDNQ